MEEMMTDKKKCKGGKCKSNSTNNKGQCTHSQCKTPKNCCNNTKN